MSGTDELQAMIDRLRAIEESAPRLAQAVVPELRAELERQISAGEAPTGEAWPKTRTGAPALRNAASALTVEAHGSVVVAQLNGPEALHHLGWGKGGVRRQILPDRVPAKLVKVLGATLQRIASGAKV